MSDSSETKIVDAAQTMPTVFPKTEPSAWWKGPGASPLQAHQPPTSPANEAKAEAGVTTTVQAVCDTAKQQSTKAVVSSKRKRLRGQRRPAQPPRQQVNKVKHHQIFGGRQIADHFLEFGGSTQALLAKAEDLEAERWSATLSSVAAGSVETTLGGSHVSDTYRSQTGAPHPFHLSDSASVVVGEQFPIGMASEHTLASEHQLVGSGSVSSGSLPTTPPRTTEEEYGEHFSGKALGGARTRAEVGEQAVESKLRFVQANLQRKTAAWTELVIDATKLSFDIALVQEPLMRMHDGISHLYGLPAGAQVVHSPDPLAKAAVLSTGGVQMLALTHLCSCFAAVAEVVGQGEHLYVVSFYCPPNDPILPRLQELESILNSLCDRPTIVGMDANGSSQLWHCRRENDRGKELKGWLITQGLFLANQPSVYHTFEGHRGSSNPDVTLLNTHSVNGVSDWLIASRDSFSDHRRITFNYALRWVRTEPEARWNFGRARWPKFTARLSRLLERTPRDVWLDRSRQGVNRRVKVLTDVLHTAQSFAVPRRRARKTPKQIRWWSEALEGQRLAVIRLRSRYRRARGQQSRVEIGRSLRQAEHAFRNSLTSSARLSWNRLANASLRREPWGLVYALAKKRNGSQRKLARSNVKTAEGNSIALAQTLVSTLEALVPSDSRANERAHHIERRALAAQGGDQSTLVPDFTAAELQATVELIGDFKAPGIDQIWGILLKHACLSDQFVDCLLAVFNDCLQLSYFPQAWKAGKLVTIPKQSDQKSRDDLKALRPITLLSVLGKTLERLIRLRLLQCFTEDQLFSKRQYGFRTRRSAPEAVSDVMDAIHDTDAKYRMVLSVDVSGAFDNLWWPAVLSEFVELGVPYQLFSLIKDYLEGRTIEYAAGGIRAEKTATKGCPQGSVLGPTLWNVCVRNLLRRLFPLGVFILAYADDIMLLIFANSRAELKSKAQEALAVVLAWAEEVKLTVSPSKTQYLILPTKYKGVLWRTINHAHPVVRINGRPLKRVTCLRYLGVLLDARLTTANPVLRLYYGACLGSNPTLAVTLELSTVRTDPHLAYPP